MTTKKLLAGCIFKRETRKIDTTTKTSFKTFFRGKFFISSVVSLFFYAPHSDAIAIMHNFAEQLSRLFAQNLQIL
jgi:hypothetical protein